MTGRLVAPARIAVLEREPLASRVVQSVHAMEEGSGSGPQAVLVTAPDRSTGPAARLARGSLRVDGDPWRALDLERALAADRPNLLWVGWAGAEHSVAVAEVCERLGVATTTPSIEVLRAIGDLAACADLAGTPPATAPTDRRERRVELETLADDRGTLWVLGAREITARPDGRVVLAESPTGLPVETARAVGDAAARLHGALGERFGPAAAAGGLTSEFAVADDGAVRLAGVTASVAPWGAATEITTGTDGVAIRLALALGGTLVGSPPQASGHAVTAVLRAEDPLDGFRPGAGRVGAVRFPGGPGLRTDAGVGPGDGVEQVSGMEGAGLAAITAWGPDRPAALGRLRRALADTLVAIPGAPNDRSFLLRVLRDDPTDPGAVAAAEEEPGAAEGAEVALVDAAIAAYTDEIELEQARFYASAARGRPEVHQDVGRTFELRHGRGTLGVRVLEVGPSRYRVQAGGLVFPVTVEGSGPYERRLNTADGPHDLVVVSHDGAHVVEVDGTPHRVTRGEGTVVPAPAPAVVVQTHVAPGDDVREGDPLVVLEAMKMEMVVAAPLSGTVTSVVDRNVQVGPGDLLVRLAAQAEPAIDLPPPRFERLAGVEGGDESAETRHRRTSENLRRLVLGYDVDAADASGLASEWAAVCAELPPDDDGAFRTEEDVLAVFADLLAVSSPRMPSGPEAEFMRAPADPFPTYLRSLDPADETLPPSFVEDLGRALAHYGIRSLQPSPELRRAVFQMARSHQRAALQAPAIVAILDRRMEHVQTLRSHAGHETRDLLDRLIAAAQTRLPAVADLAREARYRYFDQPLVERAFDLNYRRVQRHLVAIALHPDADHRRRIQALVGSPMPMRAILIPSLLTAEPPADEALLEALVRRYYRIRSLRDVATSRRDGRPVATATYEHDGADIRIFATAGDLIDLPELAATMADASKEASDQHDVLTDYFLWNTDAAPADELADHVREALDASKPVRRIRRAVVTLAGPRRDLRAPREEHFTFRQAAAEGPFAEDAPYRGLHPMMGKRLDLWRLSNFDIERLPSVEDVYLFHAVARENPKDERLLALTEVRDLTPIRDEAGRVTHLPHLERMFTEALAGIRLYQSHRPSGRRVQWNRVLLHVRPQVDLSGGELFGLMQRIAPLTEGMGLEKVVVRATMRDPESGEFRDRVMHISNPVGRGLTLRFDAPTDRPIRPLTPYLQKVVQARQRGLVYPYEIMAMLAPGREAPRDEALGNESQGRPIPLGEFVEHELDETEARLVPVDRPPGENKASIVTGLVTNFVPAYPEGMTRVVVLGDPTRALGSLAEAECRRIIAALDLAEEMDVPLEWFAVSSGARISMDSGTENMDWIGRVLRRLIEFTQAGGEVNVLVCGINVGAQPYWNAEATMLMHTRGILVMTADGAMVLTGKQALDYSGGVSAEDNFGIGGYERIMGLNGQAQYWAADVADACQLLLRHYEHTYRAPGERFPRRVPTSDPFDRDIGPSPHRGEGFATVGEVFSPSTNPERKHPFSVRSVMRAVADADHGVLERWGNMRDAETVVVWDAYLGGFPVCLLGIESKPVPRYGPVDADGPVHWTSGTLFPQSSKKAARAINAASANRPLVVLANLSGFDGSPESMRKIQLEYGAEIGRAVTNFRGPIVFLVISRYHGGAFVVFSQTLNESLEVAAVEGSYASVIGGAPAAAVVFAREIETRLGADPRIAELDARVKAADPDDRGRLRAQFEELRRSVRSEKLGEVAKEFDTVHDIHRALKMGSVHQIIEATRIRPYLIDALERGVARELGR